MLKFVVFAGHFESESPAIYDNSLILPLATQFEGGGSFVPADGKYRLRTGRSPGREPDASEICKLLAEMKLGE